MNSETPKPRKPRYEVTVRRVTRLTPRMVSVTFGGDEIANFGWNGPAAHIKLIFSPGTETTRPLMRTYTPRRFDREARELDVEFVLHGEGVASTWAEQATPGQKLTIAGPGRCYAVDPEAEWFVLMGDDSAIPAISTILEVLPASARALVYLEVPHSEEERPLSTRADARITWLARGEKPSDAGRMLEDAARGLQLPDGPGRIYVACESGAMRRIRHHLLRERQLDPSRIVTRGYWKLGATDYPDNDYGDDAKP